ncbi:hypothetical protein GCM10007856_00910 [Azospirillum oryzae]|nr:hypothetical protein GCM10007856_00910 [Azospirillum oryzae]
MAVWQDRNASGTTCPVLIRCMSSTSRTTMENPAARMCSIHLPQQSQVGDFQTVRSAAAAGVLSKSAEPAIKWTPTSPTPSKSPQRAPRSRCITEPCA